MYMRKFWQEYGGGILFILVFIVSLNIYSIRIQQINNENNNTNIAYYENN